MQIGKAAKNSPKRNLFGKRVVRNGLSLLKRGDCGFEFHRSNQVSLEGKKNHYHKVQKDYGIAFVNGV